MSKIITRKLKLTCILLLLTFSIFGQNHKIIFQSLQQGLSNKEVRCILKDSKGLMWFGTQNGLNKYNGTNFVIYENDPTDSTSLNHNSINAIIEDDNNNIWIGTSGGLNLYRREKDNFSRIKDSGGKINISSLCADKNYIWIGTSGTGLIQYDSKHEKFEYYRNQENNINTVSSNFISCIVKDGENKLWLGTWNGLDLLNIKEKKLEHFVNNPNNPLSLSNNYISSLFLDKNRELWIGTLTGGLNQLSINKNKSCFKHYLYPTNPEKPLTNNISALCADKRNNLWIGTENGGLNCLHIKSGNITNYSPDEGNPQSISSITIRSLYVDNLDILWIGTYNRGLNLVDERYNRFEAYKKNINSKYSLSGNDVRSFAEDKQGNIWIATDGGVCRLNLETRQFTKSINRDRNGLSSNAVTNVVFDQNENLWVGTWDGGIDRLNKNLVKTANYKIKGFLKNGDNKIFRLYEDKQKNIWAGTAGSGLFIYNKSTDSFVPVVDMSKPTTQNDPIFVTSVLEDCDNNIWVGTMYGLFRLTRKDSNKFLFESFYQNNTPGGLCSNAITTIFEDRKKNLWFGTDDKGLTLFNKTNNSFTVYQKQDGLPSNSICGILEDNKGNLWISTNKGIAKFEVSAKKFKTFTNEDGLVSDEFHGNSCLKVKSGELFFGANEGFNIFFPDSINENTFLPPVYLTDLKIFNKSAQIGAQGSPLLKSMGETQKIILTDKQSSFTIEFVALNFMHDSKNQYAYILEGLEKDWNYVGHKNSASYTYVKPGTYLFKVKGSNNDGVWNNTPTTLKITVLPPFWKTWWAYTIYLILLIFTFIGIRKLMISRITMQNKLQIERLEREKLEELNQSKLQFFSNVSHEFRTPLTLILGPIERLANTKLEAAVKKQIDFIHKNALRMLRLVNLLLDLQKVEKNEMHLRARFGDIVAFTKEVVMSFEELAQLKKIVLSFTSEIKKLDIWFDPDKLDKVLFNLLSNAVKFTPKGGSITIGLSKNSSDAYAPPLNNFINIFVVDTGRGMKEEHLHKIFERFYQIEGSESEMQLGTGIGLHLSKILMELHKGKITVSSQEGEGTRFDIFIPLEGNYLQEDQKIIDDTLYPVSNAIDQVHQEPLGDEMAKVTDKSNDKAKKPSKRYRILVVEDDHEIRNYIKSELQDSYDVIEAFDGIEGCELAQSQMPHLIISDVMMPRMDGIQFCKKIKTDISTSHIPVILLTARTSIENRIEGLEVGADSYIPKPFNPRHLLVRVQKLIEFRESLLSKFSKPFSFEAKEMTITSIDERFLQKAITLVKDNISNAELNIEDMSSELGMSRVHLYRKLKALTNKTPSEFVRTIRLKQAAYMLLQNKINISEVAYAVGFSSHQYFTSCFQNYFNMSPTEYIHNNQNGNSVIDIGKFE